MAQEASWYASRLRQELALRNRRYAQGRAHVESYGGQPVVVYEPENGRHGNFFDAAYGAIIARPEWVRRFNKVHAQAARSLPKAGSDPARRWRELDSSMSSDALLMNVFCTPQVWESSAIRNALGVENHATPIFGWKARVPLANGRFDRTEVDMRLGNLLVEAKLTEGDFQTCAPGTVEIYRDFDTVFERSLLPRLELTPKRQKESSRYPDEYSQEFESLIDTEMMDRSRIPPSLKAQVPPLSCPQGSVSNRPGESGYASYQLLRNVLAAYATGSSFCVLHDERRPDLREAWFLVMAAVKSAEMQVRLKVLTWQELAGLLPHELQEFLDLKYGIVPPCKTASPIEGYLDSD
jgi:hypothetical protein